MAAVGDARARLEKSKGLGVLRKYGTVGVLPGENEICSIAYKNFQGSRIPAEQVKKIHPDIFKEKYMRRDMACFGCPLHCDKYYRIDEGPYAGLATEGFQLDAVANFGGKLAIEYPPAVIKGCALCDELGLDEDNAVCVLSWAFECYQRGILTDKDTDGLKLEWGDYGVVFELLRKMAHREGFGNILAEGCKRAAGIIGRDSGYYALHTKGQDLHEEVRMPIGWGFGTSVATRGGGHTTGASVWEIMNMVDPTIGDFAKKIGVRSLDPAAYTDKAKLTVYMERVQTVVNSFGLCMFVAAWVDPSLISLKELAELYSAATGWETTEEELIRASDRVLNLEKAFNAIHAGLGRKDDYPPERSLKEPISAGRYQGFSLSKERYDEMLDEYYRLRGWDVATGWPTRQTLGDLGLSDVADDL
ncbi:MAG: aldehyde ferredoxin oxidoreductase C-terminal domain-containing protein [Dehalococcoidia bacterium]|nr:aldehyde ferredoxin oxidoreductase C-terminal domain-containing protein [Dehalococcoidia bacterium]